MKNKKLTYDELLSWWKSVRDFLEFSCPFLDRLNVGEAATIENGHYITTRSNLSISKEKGEYLIKHRFLEPLPQTWKTKERPYYTITTIGRLTVLGNPIFDVHETAELLGVSHWTLRRWLRDGKITGTRLGNTLAFSWGDIVGKKTDIVLKHNIYKTKDIAGIYGVSISKVNRHIAERKLVGTLLGEQMGHGVWAFTWAQLHEYRDYLYGR